MSTRTIRLYTDAALDPGASITLDERHAHQLRHVLRRRTGDEVRLFNGDAGEWRAHLTVERRSVRAEVEGLVRAPAPEPGPVLAIAALKRAKLELVVEKACELGASALQPLQTEHGVVDRLNGERLRTILTEAAEQSERLSVPRLQPLVPLAPWLAARGVDVPLYAALERSDAPTLDTALEAGGAGDLLVGPEGGFSSDERALIEATAGVVPVGLGPRILRAETAAILGLGVLALHMSR